MRDIKRCFVPVATVLSRTLSNAHRRVIFPNSPPTCLRILRMSFPEFFDCPDAARFLRICFVNPILTRVVHLLIMPADYAAGSHTL